MFIVINGSMFIFVYVSVQQIQRKGRQSRRDVCACSFFFLFILINNYIAFVKYSIRTEIRKYLCVNTRKTNLINYVQSIGG